MVNPIKINPNNRRIIHTIFSSLIVCFVFFLIAGFLYFSIQRLFYTKAQITESFVFTANGDIDDGTDTSAVLQSIAGSGAQFHLALGDLSYSGLTPETSWCNYIKSYVGADFPYLLIAGNHEDDEPAGNNINGFVQCLPNLLGNHIGTYGKEYYFDYPVSSPIARFILISPDLNVDGENYSYNQGTPRYNFVSNAIDDARARNIPWVIAGMHKNCITAGIKSCEIGTDLLNLLLDKRVDLILQGHDHNYQRSNQLTCAVPGSFSAGCVADPDNTLVKGAGSVLLIAGMGGKGLYSINTTDNEIGYFSAWNSSSWGAVKFTVTTGSLTGEYMRGYGDNYSDSFTITESGIPSPTSIPESPTNPPISTEPSPTLSPTPTTVIINPITVTARVSASSDDAEENTASKAVDITSTDLELGADSSVQMVGMRFTNLSIPQGASIISSSIEFEVDEAKTAQTSVVIRGEASNNALTFSTSNANISSRPKTVSQISWNNIPGWPTVNAKQQSPDISSVIQEIVNRPGWQTGNAIGLYIDGTGKRTAESYNGEPAAAAKLTVQYSIGPTATPTPTPTIDPNAPTPTEIPSPTPTFTPSPTAVPTNTPPPASVASLNPIADSYVRSDSVNSNYGTSSTLSVDGSPIHIGYLKFDLSAFVNRNIVTAKLRIKTYNNNSGGIQNIKGVSDTLWGETTIRYSNRPVLGSLLGTFKGSSKNRYYEVDVTSYAAAGKGNVVSFAIDETSSDGLTFYSRESSSSNRPVLVITSE